MTLASIVPTLLHSKSKTPLLFQSKPDPGNFTLHGQSWKNLRGHNVNSEALRQRHAKNMKLATYKLAGTINIGHDLTEAQYAKTFAKIKRHLDAHNVDAFWILEVSKRSNRIHQHLITSSTHTAEELKAIIRKACPDLKFRLQFDPIQSQGWWSNYICKSTEFRGKQSFHAAKVVLFAKHVGLKKYGFIGDFWKTKPKKPTPQENQARREHEHKITEAVTDPYVLDAAALLAQQTGIPEATVAMQYARNLVADPTLYQSYVDDGNQLRMAEDGSTFSRHIVEPFVFSPCPPAPKPPVRRKKTIKVPFPPFDPSKCHSFTLST